MILLVWLPRLRVIDMSILYGRDLVKWAEMSEEHPVSKPPCGAQIGDHKGDKKMRNRHIRRAWNNDGVMLPHNKYRGFD